MGLQFDDRKNCDWYCEKCKMGTWTQHKHGEYAGVKSKVQRLKKAPKVKRVGKGYRKEKKLGKKLWREYYKSTEFIKHL